jgi:UDP-glucose 4-epimerase
LEVREVNILVTGGLGFIGSHIVDKLVATGHNVTVFDDGSAGAKNVNPKADYWSFRLSSLQPADLVGCDAVVHAAARADISANWTASQERHRLLDSNVQGTISLLEALPSTCKNVVFLSTCAVYDDATMATEAHVPTITSPYAASKLAGEAYVAAYAYAKGFRHHTLRLSVVLGARSHHGHTADFVHMYNEGGIIHAKNDGLVKKSAVCVGDVVDGVCMALRGDMPSGVYNLAGGLWSWRDTVRVMGEMVGGSIPFDAPVDRVKGWVGDAMACVSAKKIEAYGMKWRGLEGGCRETLEALGWGR